VRLEGRTLIATNIEELPPEYKEFKILFIEKEGKAILLEYKS